MAFDTPIFWYLWSTYNKTAYSSGSLVQEMKVNGLNSVSLAFVIANSQKKPNGMIEDNLDDIKAFIGNGGKVIISLGGASGPYLEDFMSIDDIVNYLGNLMESINCFRLSMDIEGAYIADANGNNKRALIIKALQQRFGDKLFFALVLPCGTDGLDNNGLSCVQVFRSLGVVINQIQPMIMDFYISGIKWGVASCSACDRLVTQLNGIFGGNSNGLVLPIFMAGTNDDHSVFSFDDCQLLCNYVKRNGLAGISYWAYQRDQPGSDLNTSTLINQQNLAYWNVIKSTLGVGVVGNVGNDNGDVGNSDNIIVPIPLDDNNNPIVGPVVNPVIPIANKPVVVDKKFSVSFSFDFSNGVLSDLKVN